MNAAMPLSDLPPTGPSVVTVGVFDGVHLGHRAILDATRAAAARLHAISVALVFDPPPDELLRPGSRVPRLAPPWVNLGRIEADGVDQALLVRFDEEVRQLTAEAFLEALAPALEVRALAMSRASAFGRDRGGTAEWMRHVGLERGFEVIVVDPLQLAGAPVSSTRIREAIAAGNLAGARALGVTPYLEGVVVAGDGRGRELGFPTANLRFDYSPAMPSLGVYAARAALVDRSGAHAHPSLVSIGTRPTFHDDGEVLAEVHLLDFAGDLYGARVGVELVARLRAERRFETAAALVDQMRRDAVEGRAVLDAS